jgi:hypothetical protein
MEAGYLSDDINGDIRIYMTGPVKVLAVLAMDAPAGASQGDGEFDSLEVSKVLVHGNPFVKIIRLSAWSA